MKPFCLCFQEHVDNPTCSAAGCSEMQATIADELGGDDL